MAMAATAMLGFELDVPLEGQTVGRVVGGLPFAAIATGGQVTTSTGSAGRDWLMPLLNKLQGFSRLKWGWNGYRAEKPAGLPIYQAEDFLFALRTADLEPQRVGPSVVGGIGVTLKRGERKAYVEFYNDGRVYVMLSDGVGEPHIQPVRTENRGYENLISEIRGYLNG